MVVKIGVMGSCVSDDIFRSPHNYKYREDFEKTFIIARTSLISLAQKPINIEREEFIISKDSENTVHNVNCMYGDVTKRFYKVMSKDVEYLVFDLFFDAFFGVLISGDNIITNNYWHLPYTNFYKNLPEKTSITPSDNLEDFMKLFKKFSPLFFNYMKSNYPNTKIILNGVRMMEYKTLDDGSVESYVNSDNPVNKSLKIMEDYLRENFDVIFIDFEETSLDKNHIWGPGKVHYSKEYYQYTYRKILTIVKYDEFIKKTNQSDRKHDLIDKELVNDKTSIKNSDLLDAQKQYNIKIDTLTKDKKELKLKNESLESEINFIKKQLKQKENDFKEVHDDNKRLSLELNKIKDENTKIKDINNLMINSSSWKVTKPLRLLSNKMKKFWHN